MWSTLIKAVTFWGALAIAAMINGVLREGVFIPALERLLHARSAR